MAKTKAPRMPARLKRILIHYDIETWIKGCPPGVGATSMDIALASGWIVGREEGTKRPRAWMLLPAGLEALEAEETTHKRKRRRSA